MAFGESLQQRWYQDRPPPWWALPVAALYSGVSELRRRLFRRGWLRTRHLPVPVIVVGNIVAGGAGKTPLTIALVEALRLRGFKPGVASRGYGGMTRAPLLLDAQADPVLVGDEPVLIRMRSDAPVAVGVKRAEAAMLLLDEGVDVIVADDGLQHYRLGRDVEVCVVDGVRRFGNGRLLPAGPLRESEARLHEVDFVVCNGGEPRDGEIPMRFALGQAVALDDAARILALTVFAGARVHAVAGIGHPQRFFDALRALDIEVIEHPFPDHHRYAAADFDFGDDLAVLMTEKDAVKCRAFAKDNAWSVPVTARLPDSFFEAIVAKLRR